MIRSVRLFEKLEQFGEVFVDFAQALVETLFVHGLEVALRIADVLKLEGFAEEGCQSGITI